MQIDFHHAVTYVVARCAGFTHTEADTIANAAQYVDDSVETGFVRFDNEMRFYRQATAHPVLDPRNLDADENSNSWLPFHFLPGNASHEAGAATSATYAQRLICRPNSPVAKAMVASALGDRARPWALHRLGIVAHVFVDTWAHQGFIGLKHPLNQVTDLRVKATNAQLKAAPPMMPPVGHGQALTYPDLPSLHWTYRNADGAVMERNNPADFPVAADELCRVFQTWRGTTVSGLTGPQRAAITRHLLDFTQPDPDARHAGWLAALQADAFGFGAQTVRYTAKAWKDEALGPASVRTVIEGFGGQHAYPADFDFMTCHWKLFHDAARSQRHDVFVNVLPKFGILEN